MDTKSPQLHCKIETQPDGSISAVSDDLQMIVLPDGDDPPRVFNRNALQKNMRTGESTHLRVLVGELDGVRVYVSADQIILTKRDLYI